MAELKDIAGKATRLIDERVAVPRGVFYAVLFYDKQDVAFELVDREHPYDSAGTAELAEMLRAIAADLEKTSDRPAGRVTLKLIRGGKGSS